MGKLEQLREQHEDELFALLMDEVAKHEGAAYQAEAARLAEDPDAAVPEHIDVACREAIRRGFVKKRKKIAWSKVLQRIAVAILLLAALVTVTFAAVPEIRIWAMNLVIETFEDHSEFNFTEGGATSDHLTLNPGWIPEGFTLTKESQSSLAAIKVYKDMNGVTIYIEKSLVINQGLCLDTEDVVLSEIKIQEQNATLAAKESEAWLLLPSPDNGYAILIKTKGMPDDILIKIAENIPLRE